MEASQRWQYYKHHFRVDKLYLAGHDNDIYKAYCVDTANGKVLSFDLKSVYNLNDIPFYPLADAMISGRLISIEKAISVLENCPYNRGALKPNKVIFNAFIEFLKARIEFSNPINISNMKPIGQIYETTDYSVFKKLTGNRNVKKIHVRRLRESFKNVYLFSPIIVNENFYIIDGQHRFEAAKELQKPIYYIVCKGYGLKEVQILNTNMKNWGKMEYLNAFCDLQYPEYLIFRNFMMKFKEFPISACEALLTNKTGRSTSSSKEVTDNKSGSYAVRYFEEGDLEINDYNLAVENAEKIMMIKPYYDGFNRAIFVFTMVGLFKHKNYDHSWFMKKIQRGPNHLKHCPNVTEYKKLIEDIYNYGKRDPVSLRY